MVEGSSLLWLSKACQLCRYTNVRKGVKWDRNCGYIIFYIFRLNRISFFVTSAILRLIRDLAVVTGGGKHSTRQKRLTPSHWKLSHMPRVGFEPGQYADPLWPINMRFGCGFEYSLVPQKRVSLVAIQMCVKWFNVNAMAVIFYFPYLD